MTLEEVSLWNAHFRERPPDAIERLLGLIVVTLMNAHRKENSPSISLYQVAPWLESADARKKREFDEQTDYLTHIYHATLDD